MLTQLLLLKINSMNNVEKQYLDLNKIKEEIIAKKEEKIKFIFQDLISLVLKIKP